MYIRSISGSRVSRRALICFIKKHSLHYRLGIVSMIGLAPCQALVHQVFPSSASASTLQLHLHLILKMVAQANRDGISSTLFLDLAHKDSLKYLAIDGMYCPEVASAEIALHCISDPKYRAVRMSSHIFDFSYHRALQPRVHTGI